MVEHGKTHMGLGTKSMIGLGAGLTAGAAIGAFRRPGLLAFGSGIELAGTVWINAILMTILPLVVSKLVVSVAGHEGRRSIERSGWWAAGTMAVLLVAGATLAAAVIPAVFSWLPIDPAASASLRTAIVPAQATEPLSVARWVASLVPANAFRAAAEGAIVPVLVFAVAFALGASRIPDALRRPLVTFFQAVDAAISVLLQWIVGLAPYGVFALGLGLSMRVGAEIVSALGYYVLVSSATQVLFTALLYLVVLGGAGISPLRLGRAVAPAQAMAFSTHSSMAALPAMIQGTQETLGLSQTATGFVLPLSLAIFKFSGPIWFVVVVYFVGWLYGIPIDPSRSGAIVLTAVVTSFAIGGVPSGAAVVVAPVLSAAGLPVEAMGVLLAVDPIPNAFRTVANVTAMMAVTAISDRRAGELEVRMTAEALR